jgi:hypothetical protein
MFAPTTQGEVQVEVRSLNQGGTVKAGEGLVFIVHGDPDSSRDLQLEIILTDSQGEGVWSRSLSAPLVNEELELVLPELATGEYTVQFRVAGSDPGAGEQKLTFFYVEGDYAITGLSSYPPSTMPGSEITVRAELQAPAGADPYVRWTQGDSLLARGRLSEGLDRIVWRAPREEGVYPVTVELFPVPPPGSADFPFSSPLSMTARLFITASPTAPVDSLVPEASYHALFHFDGSLEMGGWLAAEAGADKRPTAEAFGGASYATDGPAAGYRLGPGAGIRFTGLILPVVSAATPGSSEEGAARGRRDFAPFTLTLLLVPEEPPRETTLLVVRSTAGKNVLSLSFDAGGILQGSLASAAGPIELPSGIGPLEPSTLQRIDLSVYPEESSLTALWFLNGIQTAAIVRPGTSAEIPAEAETVIGGGPVALGVIAELGVYFQDEQGRPTVDPAIYRAAMQKRLGRELILAEGFEGLLPPAGFSIQGPVSWDRGALTLRPGSSLDSPLFESVLPATVLELEARSGFPPESRIVLSWEGAEQGFAVITGNGRLLAPGNPEAAVTVPAVPSPLVIHLTADALLLTAERFGENGSGDSPPEPPRLPIRPAPGGSRWLRLSVSVPRATDGAPLELDRILVYRPSGQ